MDVYKNMKRREAEEAMREMERVIGRVAELEEKWPEV